MYVKKLMMILFILLLYIIKNIFHMNIKDIYNMKTPCAGVIIFRKTNDGYACLILEENDNKKINYLYSIGFPKGKREKNKNESSYECAKRELYEETKINFSQLNFVESLYLKEYAHNKLTIIYLIGIMKDNNIDIQFDNREIKSALFYNYSEAKQLLRLKFRQNILDKAYNAIINTNTKYICGDEFDKKYNDYILSKNMISLNISA